MKRLRWNKILFLPLAGVLALAVLTGASPRQVGQAKGPVPDLTAVKSFGSRQAPITIEVFSDYQCPQCKVFYQDTARQLMNNYVSAGKVYLVHRDFPLSMHSHSREAARWANAAAMAGVFEAADQALYARQDDWAATGKIEEALAGTLPVADMKKVRVVQSTQGAQIDAAIARDVALGESRNVSGTPSIYVFHKGQMTPLPPGGVNYSLLKQYLDYLLQQR